MKTLLLPLAICSFLQASPIPSPQLIQSGDKAISLLLLSNDKEYLSSSNIHTVITSDHNKGSIPISTPNNDTKFVVRYEVEKHSSNNYSYLTFEVFDITSGQPVSLSKSKMTYKGPGIYEILHFNNMKLQFQTSDQIDIYSYQKPPNEEDVIWATEK